MTSLTESPAWKALEAQHRDLAGRSLRSLFAEDPRRFDNYSLRLGDLLFDYSKHRITDATLRLLLDLADQAELHKKIDQMFSGERINITERRPVLHVALRNPPIWKRCDDRPDNTSPLGPVSVRGHCLR
jgi:glucose-6-phosphate isomerase